MFPKACIGKKSPKRASHIDKLLTTALHQCILHANSASAEKPSGLLSTDMQTCTNQKMFLMQHSKMACRMKLMECHSRHVHLMLLPSESHARIQ